LFALLPGTFDDAVRANPAHHLQAPASTCRAVIRRTVLQRFASPSLGARQPFLPCWLSASPIYSRSVPARSGCVRRLLLPRRRRHHTLDRPPLSSASASPSNPR